jgi:hypothetical protein
MALSLTRTMILALPLVPASSVNGGHSGQRLSKKNMKKLIASPHMVSAFRLPDIRHGTAGCNARDAGGDTFFGTMVLESF